jgi:hypothetical protein
LDRWPFAVVGCPDAQDLHRRQNHTPESLLFYRRVMAGGVPYEQVADQYGINTFFLSHKSAETRELIAELYRDGQRAPHLGRFHGGRKLVD